MRTSTRGSLQIMSSPWQQRTMPSWWTEVCVEFSPPNAQLTTVTHVHTLSLHTSVDNIFTTSCEEISTTPVDVLKNHLTIQFLGEAGMVSVYIFRSTSCILRYICCLLFPVGFWCPPWVVWQSLQWGPQPRLCPLHTVCWWYVLFIWRLEWYELTHFVGWKLRCLWALYWACANVLLLEKSLLMLCI